MNLQSAKKQAAAELRRAGIESPDLDARLLLELATGWDRTQIIMNSAEILPDTIWAQLQFLTARRIAGEPIDHILGHREFYGRTFVVTRDVLSPRPETEGLIDQALIALSGKPAPRILDLGTGSGAIAISVLAECLGAGGIAVDISQAALTVAKENAENHGVKDRLTFVESHWFDSVDGEFDVIMSNPPYITDAAMLVLSPEVKGYDPDISLRGGEDGLIAYHEIAGRAKDYLKPGGALIAEIGYDQGDSVLDLFRRAGFHGTELFQDLSGHDRIIKGLK